MLVDQVSGQAQHHGASCVIDLDHLSRSHSPIVVADHNRRTHLEHHVIHGPAGVRTNERAFDGSIEIDRELTDMVARPQPAGA